MPLCIERRCSEVCVGSYRGPSVAAAVICAATPTFITLVGSVFGPDVTTWQFGFEHRYATRFASVSFTALGKSSRIDIWTPQPLRTSRTGSPEARQSSYLFVEIEETV